MNRKQGVQRLDRGIRALADRGAAAAIEPPDGDQLAREAIHSFSEQMDMYRRRTLSEPEWLDPNESPERMREAILATPPEHVSFLDIERLSRLDPALATARWEEVKAAARRDLEMGWRAGRALESMGGSAWERACFLAIRASLHEAWSPRHAGEAMLLNEMAQYEMIRLGWLRILSTMSREPETETSLRRPNPNSDRPRTQDAAHATFEAMRMVERLQRLYQSALRALLNARRGRSAFIVQRSGQINVAFGPQANAYMPRPEAEGDT